MSAQPAPAEPPAPAELTVRAIVLGGVITLLFTAANVYLGLKVGLTFATSIPAAVISMAILRYLPGATILENNIVQTVASAAGTLAAIIFVLPALVIIGWWHGFPYATTAAITGLGGVLGVMFSVPLRRALVIDTDLPYPEGRAAAEVLRIGSESRAGAEESAAGLRMLSWSSVVSAAFAVSTQTGLVAGTVARWFRVGAGATGAFTSLSFALLGVGHLVGLSVGMAMLVGLLISYGVLLPNLTALHPIAGSVEHWATTIFRSDVRFFGAGVIGVAAVWTLLSIARPVVGGVTSALRASRARGAGMSVAVTERDIPIQWVAGGIVLTLGPIAALLWSVLAGGPLAASAWLLIAGSLLFVLVIGLMIAAVCGYMAGLIGASNSPVSGIGILSVLAAALLLAGLFGRGVPPGTTQALIAYAIIVTGIVFGIATISNDNLQDLKTGELVGATPWKQQVALLFGVAFGALVVPPVLDLLNTSFGFAGTPGAGARALAAPQAGLIAALAQGVLQAKLNVAMLGYGAAAGAALIVLDLGLGRAGLLRLPPLAIGLGVYLPMDATLPVVIGAVVGTLYDRHAATTRDPERARRMGVLAATGMIVGESLWGVAFAGVVAATGKDAPLTLIGERFAEPALVIGVLGYAALVWALYRYARRSGN